MMAAVIPTMKPQKQPAILLLPPGTTCLHKKETVVKTIDCSFWATPVNLHMAVAAGAGPDGAIFSLPAGPAEPDKVGHGINAQKAQEEDIYQADEEVAHDRVVIINHPVDGAADHDTHGRTSRKVMASFTETLPSFYGPRSP